MKNYVIIVAGGSGTRMNSSTPKQFITLNNKPVLMHTIEKFVEALPGIRVIIVLSAALHDTWKQLCLEYKFNIPVEITQGGETRFHSVKNGLALVPEGCIVGIHDAARPLVSKQTIISTYATAEMKGNASPAIPINESIREVKMGLNRAVDRNHYFTIQTPQCFHATIIKKAFLQEYETSFTDDASVLEATGQSIHLVEGNKENIKITTPHDLIIAQALIAYQH